MKAKQVPLFQVMVSASLLSGLLQDQPAWADGACPAPSFAAARTFAAGSSPHSVAVGDFNSDGQPDLAVAGDDGVSVLLANGDGTFKSAVSYNAGKYPHSLTVGDFNGDGKPDLAVANSGGVSGQGNVSVLLGKGDGTFQAHVNYDAGAGPLSVAVGDFNGDGKSDLAVASFGSYDQGSYTNSSLSVLLGNGDGTFRTAVPFRPGEGCSSVTVGDFNADGKPDLAVTTGSGVSVLLGQGDGTFQTALHYGVGGSPSSIAVSDFNNDGKPDLVVAHGTVSVLLGNGDGTFQAALAYDGSPGSYSVAVGDFNHDGKPDLAASGYGTQVLLGQGDGTFQTAVHYGPVSYSSWVAVGDFNGDGKPDLAVVNRAGVSIFSGQGDGTFQSMNFAAIVPGCSSSVALGDFNGDGKLDLVVGKTILEGVITHVSVLLGNGDGTFRAPVNYGTGANSVSVAVSDFNGDGTPDLAAANSGGQDISVLLGNGDGTFHAAINYHSGWAKSVAAGDLNADGKPDLAVATGGGVSVLLGNGDGSFQSPLDFSLRLGLGSDCVAIGDLNGDHKADVIVVGHYSSTVTVLLGRGNGAFEERFSVGLGLYFPEALAVGDLNGDGRPDVAVANFGYESAPGSVAVFLANSDGSLRPAVNYPTGTRAVSVAIGDFNGDGKPDLAAATWGGVSVLLGRGDGTFQTAATYGDGVFSVAVGDFNNDGKPDLAVAVCSGVSVLFNTCASAGGHLTVARRNTNLILSWPLPYTGVTLESTTNLGSTNWQRVSAAMVTENGRCEVSVPLGSGSGYFRLHKP